jgi:predicted phosphohydrolase
MVVRNKDMSPGRGAQWVLLCTSKLPYIFFFLRLQIPNMDELIRSSEADLTKMWSESFIRFHCRLVTWRATATAISDSLERTRAIWYGMLHLVVINGDKNSAVWLRSLRHIVQLLQDLPRAKAIFQANHASQILWVSHFAPYLLSTRYLSVSP